MSSQHDEQRDDLGIRNFFRILRRRKLYASVVVIVVLATAGFYIRRLEPVYQSVGQVLVLNPTLSPTTPFSVNVETESAIASSPDVAKRAASSLGYQGNPNDLLGGLDVAPASGTNILTFTYTSASPTVAQSDVGAFVDAYLADRNARVAEQFTSSYDAIQQLISETQAKLATAKQRFDATSDAATKSRLLARENSLSQQILFLRQQQLLTLTGPQVGSVIERASYPTLVDTRRRIAILAVVAALALGAAVALLAERLDDRLRGRHDLAAHAGAPVLATVPTLRSWRRGKDPVLAVATAPDSDTSEAYRRLRTGLLFLGSERNVKTVLVTSARAGEGKSATVANLAAVLGRAGKRVVVVAADLRRPRVASFFGIPDGRSSMNGMQGLTNVLADEVDVGSALRDANGHPNVRVLPSGPMVGTPAELLESNSMRRVIARLRADADFVLIDGAPILGVSDGLALARLADGVILVADAGRTPRTAVTQASDQLSQMDATIIGAVLNNLDARGVDAYEAY
jgi:polysaccharide biosynthesis transport protein